MNTKTGSSLNFLAKLGDAMEMLNLSMRLQLGRRFWVVPLLCLIWPLFQAFRILVLDETQGLSPSDAQNYLIGFPLVVLAIGLGIQIIAAEIEQRTLEVCYTVPGGAIRIWLSKIAAAAVLLIVAEIILALITVIFFTTFPWSALYGAFQGAVFYLVLGMSFGALFGNRLTAGVVTAALLVLNAFITGFGDNPTRYSPLFNPLALENTGMVAIEVTAWTIQNRIGVALATLAIATLTFARADRREKLLSGH